MNYVVPLVLGSVTLGLCVSSTAAVLFMLGFAAFTVLHDRGEGGFLAKAQSRKAQK